MNVIASAFAGNHDARYHQCKVFPVPPVERGGRILFPSVMRFFDNPTDGMEDMG